HLIRVLHLTQMTSLKRVILAAAALLCAIPPAISQDLTAYIGTYTRGKSKGIYAWRFSLSSGKLTSLGLAAETSNPSFLAVHPNRRFLYAVNENATGTVTAFSIDSATGKLTQLNSASSRGNGPCHLAVDHSGKWLFVANYGSGSIAVLPIHDDGSLGEASAFVQHSGSSVNKQRQSGPHAHCVTQSPDGRFLLVEDLGLDEVLVYRFEASKGALTANDPPFAKLAPGTGPRHMAFTPNGRFAYVVGEMLSNVTAFRYDAARGSLAEFQTVPMLPPDFQGNNSGAEIAVHPNGKFLYASNRGHNSIAVYSIDAGSGTLRVLDHVATQGKTPRNFAIDPTGAWLFAAHQDSDSIVVFRIDAATGIPKATGEVLEAGAPVCVTFVAAR
ncbi:MAG TPA: lactonase family protein, partial [Candidatus Sulfopaludibacter sp.]|nr:lactonase family protein [Candidatus Sulfopaludibacter sp.]